MALVVSVTGLFVAAGKDFVTSPVDRLELDLNGIAGDLHAGPTRKSGAREPWHPRGTIIRNDRQLSILGDEDLAEIARGMGLPTLPATWVGANMTLSGHDHLSALPPMTRLMAPSGATLAITGYNAPCRQSGRAIAVRSGDAAHEFGFVKAGKGRRGLVAYVERAGAIEAGDSLKVIEPRLAG